jgi:hypothetical protein
MYPPTRHDKWAIDEQSCEEDWHRVGEGKGQRCTVRTLRHRQKHIYETQVLIDVDVAGHSESFPVPLYRAAEPHQAD